MTSNKTALVAIATFQTAKVAAMPTITNANKTAVYLATQQLSDIVYQASVAAIQSPGEK